MNDLYDNDDDMKEIQLNACALEDNDVLIGRGLPVVRHKGNIRFRKMVQERMGDYIAAGNQHAVKAEIARTVIAEVFANNGRFIRRDNDDTLYLVEDPGFVLEKAKQAFRDLAKKEHFRLSNKKRRKRKQDLINEEFASEDKNKSALDGQDNVSLKNNSPENNSFGSDSEVVVPKAAAADVNRNVAADDNFAALLSVACNESKKSRTTTEPNNYQQQQPKKDNHHAAKFSVAMSDTNDMSLQVQRNFLNEVSRSYQNQNTESTASVSRTTLQVAHRVYQETPSSTRTLLERIMGRNVTEDSNNEQRLTATLRAVTNEDALMLCNTASKQMKYGYHNYSELLLHLQMVKLQKRRQQQQLG